MVQDGVHLIRPFRGGKSGPGGTVPSRAGGGISCGDVGLVSAYLQALTNEGVASVLVISHLPLVGYLVAELCPGETPPMFTTSAIASVTLDESGNGTFNWQMSPCNLKMAKAI